MPEVMTIKQLKRTINWMLDNCCKQDVQTIVDAIETDIPYEKVWTITANVLEQYKAKHA